MMRDGLEESNAFLLENSSSKILTRFNLICGICGTAVEIANCMTK